MAGQCLPRELAGKSQELGESENRVFFQRVQSSWGEAGSLQGAPGTACAAALLCGGWAWACQPAIRVFLPPHSANVSSNLKGRPRDRKKHLEKEGKNVLAKRVKE